MSEELRGAWDFSWGGIVATQSVGGEGMAMVVTRELGCPGPLAIRTIYGKRRAAGESVTGMACVSTRSADPEC